MTSFRRPALTAVALLASCGGPSGLVGVRWGDDSAAAARKLGADCATWSAWKGRQGFETCEDLQHPVDAFGRQAVPRLFRAGNRIEGLALEFLGCDDPPRLESAIREKFGERGSGQLYVVYWNDSVVHFERSLTAQDSCVLTVAGPRFGKAFQSYQLGIGMRDFAAGLRPR